MAMQQNVPDFSDINKIIDAEGVDVIQVVPPSNPKNSILTGSVLYSQPKSFGEGRYFGQVRFSAAPATLLNPFSRDNPDVLRYAKLTFQFNRKDRLPTDAEDPHEPTFIEQRAEFRRFVERLEDIVLEKIKQDPQTYFGKPIDPDDVILKRSMDTPEEDKYRETLACKIDTTSGTRENLPVHEISPNIKFQHVELEGEDNMKHTDIRVQDILFPSKVVPIIRSVYPYFEVQKNHRTGKYEGYVKLQWPLGGVQRIDAGRKRKREEDNEPRGDWVGTMTAKTLKRYTATVEEPTD